MATALLKVYEKVVFQRQLNKLHTFAGGQPAPGRLQQSSGSRSTQEHWQGGEVETGPLQPRTPLRTVTTVCK